MRPNSLFYLFSDVNRLAGVGPGIKQHLLRLLGSKAPPALPVRDLIFYLPLSVVDRRNSPSLSMVQSGEILTVTVAVGAHYPPAGRQSKKSPYKVVCHAPDGSITLTFFYTRGDYLTKLLPEGQQRVISGRVERYGSVLQMPHPDIITTVEKLNEVMLLEPVYGLTAGLSNRQLRKVMETALEKTPELPEWHDAALMQREGWKSWRQALFTAHHPHVAEDVLPISPSRLRLAYDELLANQLALSIVRRGLRKQEGIALPPSVKLREQALSLLPFTLTGGQKEAVKEIDGDLMSGERMLRLLQGDVGSGKTVVALMAMLTAVENGMQAALMAPTELLAKQHARFLTRITEQLGLQTVLLTGSLKSASHTEALAKIASGEAQIVVGTHALFQDKVQFAQLGLAVIDEQHRFGVRQRTALINKSPRTHLLVMTATPIPRTLVMAAYGDMDNSILAEKPAGRQEISTKAIPASRAEDVLQGLGRALQKGEKVYWICPLIEARDGTEEESELPDLAAAQARYVEFTHRFGKRVALAHGKMSQAERDEAMQGFAADKYDMLVATTVVEVGVDVPEATIVVIEHAERFGLSQLHQLRGRVGRGSNPSACILLYDDSCGEIAKARLRVLRETNDGFRIAEEDCRLRGGGDVLGTRQSGMPEFSFADMQHHVHLLAMARDDAKLILERDPALNTERGHALRALLYLFRHDENVRLLEGG